MSLDFLIYKMGVTVVPTLEGYSKDLIRHTEKMGMVLDTWEVLGE